MTPTESTAASETSDVALPEKPGQTLRRARERAGFSIEDLAAQLKLTRATLEALEADDFETLHEPVYVRGYYRKCSKVLPVTSAELIAAYDVHVKPVAPASPRRVPLAGGANIPTSGAGGGGLYLALGAGLLFGIALWLGSGESPTPAPIKPATVPVAAEPEPLPSVPDASVETETPVAPDPAATATTVTTPVETTSETVVVLPPPPAPVVPPAAVVASETLTMNFTEASWVRVEDARNKMLLIGLVRAGERKVLRGEVPYTVFIGNAQKVQVEFRGKLFDFSRYVQNDTARFTVP